jgi:hypothetical protein
MFMNFNLNKLIWLIITSKIMHVKWITDTQYSITILAKYEHLMMANWGRNML